MKKHLERWLRNSPFFGLVQRVRFKFRPISRRSSKYQSAGVTILDIQENVSLEIYWVGSGVGPGPSASLFVHGDEVMRFDCFGGKKGHFHVNLTQARYFSRGESARLYFPEGRMADQVKLAEFELRRNFEYARRLNNKRKVRSVRVPRERLENAAQDMQAEMLRLISDFGESSDFALSSDRGRTQGVYSTGLE